jgi:hypothetical protein
MTSFEATPKQLTRRNGKSSARLAEVPDKVVAPGYPDNLVPVALSTSPLKIVVPWNDDFAPAFGGAPADQLQLLWDGVPIGAAVDIEDSNGPGTPPALVLPLAADDGNDWGSRPHRLGYRITWGLGGGSDLGEVADVYIDRTAPGGLLNGRLELPSVGEENLVTPGQLDELERLPGQVPSYSGKWEGDTIIPYINNGTTVIYLTDHAVQLPPGPVDGQPVILYFPRAELEAAGDGVRFLGYKIIDLFGNESVDSAFRVVRLLLDDVPEDGNLFAPVIPLFSDDGIITEADARVLKVQIPTFDHVHQGDAIRLYWGGTEVGLLPVNDESADPLLEFSVSYQTIQQGGVSPYNLDVYYEVLRLGVVLATSPLLNVLVDLRVPGGVDPDPETPAHGNLANASVLGEGGGTPNLITAQQYGRDADITVPWPAPAGTPVDPSLSFVAGDELIITWGSFTLPTPFYTITPADVAAGVPLHFTLRGSDMSDEGAGTIPLSYSVSRRFPAAGGIPEYTNTAYSDVQDVLVIGANEIPGGGQEMFAGNFSRLNANNALNFALTRNGAPYRIIVQYDNVADNDVIVLSMQGYQGVGDIELPGTDYTDSHIVGPDDRALGYYEFTVPERLFTAALFPGVRNNIKVNYTVTNTYGTGNSATSTTLIDLRGGGSSASSRSSFVATTKTGPEVKADQVAYNPQVPLDPNSRNGKEAAAILQALKEEWASQ